MNKHLGQHHQPVVIATHHPVTANIAHYTAGAADDAAIII